jgi:hypothetical protein
MMLSDCGLDPIYLGRHEGVWFAAGAVDTALEAHSSVCPAKWQTGASTCVQTMDALRGTRHGPHLLGADCGATSDCIALWQLNQMKLPMGTIAGCCEHA